MRVIVWNQYSQTVETSRRAVELFHPTDWHLYDDLMGIEIVEQFGLKMVDRKAGEWFLIPKF